MSILKIHYHLLNILLLSSVTLLGQESRKIKNDTLKTENVTVIKTFNPTINDAFKIETQQAPNLNIKENKSITNFRIQSVPVASTFVPKKANSKRVKKARKKLRPQNYASLAGGNFGNVEAEAFVNYEVNREALFSALLVHQSSQGGIDNIRIDDFYYDTGLRLSYTNQNKKTPWGAYFEAQHQLYNWYGIPTDLVLSTQQISEIDPSHNFIDVNIGGNITFDSDTFKNIEAKLRYFFDDQKSKEINAIIKSNIEVEINDYEIQLPIVLDILSGNFNQEDFLPEVPYQIFNFGVQPTVAINYNGIDLTLGGSAYISSDTENNKTSFFVYPNILATYQFKDYGITVYGGVSGELKQNTYHNASETNPFIAPLLSISPTNKQFDFYVGAYGNLTSELTYKLKASYISEEDKPLYQNSPSVQNATAQANYGFNNSFIYVYADIDTGNLEANLKYSFSNSLDFSLTANLFAYNTSGTPEAWNLPQIQTTLSSNYRFNEKLSFDTDIFYVGKRKDFSAFENRVVDVDQFFDINLGANYNITKNWNAFVKGKNLTNQNYERWLNFPVQSAQVLLGVKYLFN